MKTLRKIIYFLFAVVVSIPILILGTLGIIFDFLHEHVNLTKFTDIIIDKTFIIKKKLLYTNEK